jgi:hypothetical protein
MLRHTLAALTLLLGFSAIAQERPRIFEVAERLQARVIGHDFYVYTKERRVAALEEFKNAVEDQYSLILVKLRNANIDVLKELDDAVERELKINDLPQDSSKLDLAHFNLDFLDRYRALIAKFKDSHFSSDAAIPLAQIILALDFIEIDGKFRVIETSDKLLEYSNIRQDMISLGDELIEIDGKSPNDAIKELLPYISASSDVYARSEAVKRLSFREFKFPKNGYVVVKIKNSKGHVNAFRLNRFYKASARSDQAQVFAADGYIKLTEPFSIFNEQTKKWQTDGDDWKSMNVHLPLIQESIYTSSNKPFLRTGYLLHEGKVSGVIDLRGFQATVTNEKDEVISTIEVMSEFLTELSKKQIPLVIDLRKNVGGSKALINEMIELFALEEQKYSMGTMAYRINPRIMSLYQRNIEASNLGHMITFYDHYLLMTEVEKAFQQGQVHSPLFLSPEITTEKSLYKEKMVVWISESCISACEVFSAEMKRSARAVLVGKNSNGTGAGFWGNSDWVDSKRTISATIPNFLFGSAVNDTFEGVQFLPDEKIYETNTENKPLTPDVPAIETWKSYEESLPLVHIEKSWQILF